ncbi:hydrophobic/amphiphilic exporter-1, HAE1 family [Carboxydocella thermautotrophica]|nr:hydrophobic/amphiphilic exporter-1, HAE1 family [Carboxydocella thermautotrophica]
MNITRWALEKTRALSVLFALLAVLGIIGYRGLGVDLFPVANLPYVTILTIYPGAGAAEIEQTIVDPIGEAVAPLAGLKRINSTAGEGIAMTVLEFTMSTNADTAAQDAQKAIDGIINKLPKDAQKPVVKKFDFNNQPFMTLALTGPFPANELYRLADEKLKDALQNIQGVAQVDIVGGQKQEVQINVDLLKLEQYGLTLNQLARKLAAENLNVPSGQIAQGEREYGVRLVGQFTDLDDIRHLPLLPGLTLDKVAEVKMANKENRDYSRLNGQEAVALIIQKQSSANLVATAEQVTSRLQDLERLLPPGVKLSVVKDDSTFTNASLKDTQRNLVEGVLMTGLVLFFFLREWRSLLIALLAIPVSIISTFMAMKWAGFSLNLLSLMGLSLSVGILVDDSIVVLENIHRHLKQRKSGFQAALDGRMEIGLAAVAITLSDVVVFGPMAFMKGMVGQFFREFGLTVVFATLFSLLVSFTLTPALASRLFASGGKEAQGSFWRYLERLGAWVVVAYRRALLWTLDHRGLTILVVLLLVGGAVALIPLGFIGTEFIARTDQNRFTITLELPEGASLRATDAAVKKLEARVRQLPELKSYLATIGRNTGQKYGISSAVNLGSVDVLLVDKKERQRTVWEIMDEVRTWAPDFPGIKLVVSDPGIVGGRGGLPIQIEVTGPDFQTLEKLASQVERIVRQTPGTVDVMSSWKKEGKPEWQLILQRERAALLGVTAYEAGTTLRTAVDGQIAGVLRQQGKETDVRLQARREQVQDREQLAAIKVQTLTGDLVTLAQVADLQERTAPPVIYHKDRQRLITVSANYQGRKLGDVTGDIQRQLDQLVLPPGYHISFYGEQKDMEESFQDLIQALLLSIMFVYMILVVLYESYLTPFIRMLSLPAGLIGALAALAITGNSLNILSLIGLIMLDGLAAKNGTLLIDYTNTLRARGLSLREALLEAGTTRLRPIFMTSMTMIFGMLPTALAVAEGAEMRSSMGIVLVGGLLTSTILTPLLIPAAYTLIEEKLLCKTNGSRGGFDEA